MTSKVSPGTHLRFLDYRTGEWVHATVVRCEMLANGEWVEVDYPCRLVQRTDNADGIRLSVIADFYADKPKILWPCRRRGADNVQVEEVLDE